MRAKNIFKLIFLAVFSLALGFFWEHPWMVPLKVLVVYLHELSHALGAVFSGGNVQLIHIDLNESGFTRTLGGNFLAIAGSGYLGSILFGSLMLHAGLSGKFVRFISWGLGVFIVLFTLVVPDKIPTLALSAGLAWAGTLILTVSMFRQVNRFILFLLGGLTSLYALYDLLDFFQGEILNTDAGLISRHYFEGETTQITVAYLIAVFIVIVSIWIQYRLILHALSEPEEEVFEEIEELPQPPAEIPPELTMQVAELIRLYNNGEFKNDQRS